ncbi:MAG: arylsulfatase [Pirellula sp.]|nr:arylsulfatase [Pirellula sp.]
MERLNFWLLLLLTLGLTGQVSAYEAPKEIEKRPRNVVFILADDLGWADVGCYGQMQFQTPNLDRLAAQGMRFTQHYSGAPVCAPSRCVLMTGLHLGHAEIRGNKQAKVIDPQFEEGQVPLSENATTLASILRNHGYRTGAFGKWGLGPVHSSGSPDKQGFEEFFGYNCQAIAHSYYPATLWNNTTRIPFNVNPIPGHSKQPSGEVRCEDWVGENYAPYRMMDEAIQFLKESSDRPFFLYLPLIEPHVALHPPLSRLDDFPREWDTEVYRGENGYLPTARPRAAYAALVTDIDRYVGRVLDTLDELKIANETLVIFTSDNGATHPSAANPKFNVGGADTSFFQSTAYLRGNKGSVHEGGIRVPMIARLPGVIEPASVSESPTYFADWLPTILEATKVDNPDYQRDGESFWELLTGENQNWKRANPMIWVFPEYGGQVAIRSEQWKLIRKQLNSPERPGPWELYDLSQDESEQIDVAWKYPELVQLLSDRLTREMDDNELFPVTIPKESE